MIRPNNGPEYIANKIVNFYEARASAYYKGTGMILILLFVTKKFFPFVFYLYSRCKEGEGGSKEYGVFVIYSNLSKG